MSGPIICGVDDSSSAKGAARVARGLSALLGQKLLFVHVFERGSAEERIGAVAERLQRLTVSLNELDSGAGWLLEVGHPADRLAAVARDEDASLIVVGSTGPRSSLLGSVSADVSRRAPCPVVVVPPGADEIVLDGAEQPRLENVHRLETAPPGAIATHRMPGGTIERASEPLPHRRPAGRAGS